jgi:hypothetical protein
MAREVQDIAKELLLTALDGHGKDSDNGKSGSHGISGTTGMVAGAGAAALAPVALRSLGKALGIQEAGDILKSPGEALGGITSRLGESVGGGIGDKVTNKVDEAGGPSAMLGDAVKSALPFGGGGGGGTKGGAPGAGKGRRMPVQQAVDIGAPLETVYNQWTQFEDWPSFMHRVTRASQEDDCTVAFSVKIWGKTKEFTAKIETQRPDERVKWKVTQGMIHSGVVTFHELGPNLTRVLLTLDVEPGSIAENLARGLRLAKRAARGDLHRFGGFIEVAEHETGAWRGTIEDGELVEEHDPSYDKKREYADLDELVSSEESEDGDDDSEDEDAEDEKPKRGRAQQARGRTSSRSASKSSSGRGSSRSSGSKSSSARKSSGGSGGGRGRASGSAKASSSRSAKASSSSSSSRSRRGSSTSKKSSGRRNRSRGSKS